MYITMSNSIKKDTITNDLFSDLTDPKIKPIDKESISTNIISSGFQNFLVAISAIVALYLLIIVVVSRSKLMPALVVGIFISFILKTCFDVIKIMKIIKNKLYGKINTAILSIGIVLYIFFMYASSKLYHILLKNLKSKCTSKIVNLDALAIIYIILILFDNVILNNPDMYLFSIIVYVCVGLAMMLYYKNEIPNLKNKLEDNCKK
jgi:hypothetical protein